MRRQPELIAFIEIRSSPVMGKALGWVLTAGSAQSSELSVHVPSPAPLSKGREEREMGNRINTGIIP